MKENAPNNQDRRSRGFGRRHRPRPEADLQPRLQIPPQACALCGQMIQEMPSAIAYGPEGSPAHFDCVVKDLETKETPKEGEKIAYLGAGMFGVIKPQEGEGVPFVILKKIQVESKDNQPEWRKDIKNQLKK